MANRFDLPQGTQSQYQSTYVPLPLQEIAGLAKQHQEAYQKNADDTYALHDMITQVNAIDEHQGFKKELDSKYAPKIADLTDKLTSGKDNFVVQNEINKLKREWLNDSKRLEMEKSFIEKGMSQKERIKLGEKYADFLDPNSHFKGSTEDGGINPFRFNGMGEKLDIEKRFHDAMQGLKEDTKGWDVESLDMNSGIKIGQKGTRGGITPDKVMNLAKQKVMGILENTLEGEQFIKKVKYYNPKATPEDIINAATKQLFDSGSNQIHSNKTDGNSIDPTVIWSANREDRKKKEEIESEYTLGMTQGNAKLNPEGEKEADADAFVRVTGLSKDLVNADGTPNFKTQDGATAYYMRVHQAMNNLGLDINNFKKKNGSTDYNAARHALIQVGKNLNTEVTNYQNIQANLSENLSKHIFGESNAKDEFEVSPSFGKMDIYEQNNPETAKEYKLADKKAAVARNAKVVGLDFNDSNLGAISFVSTTGRDGVEPKLFNGVTPDEGIKTLMKPVHAYTQDMNKLRTGNSSWEDLQSYRKELVYGSKDSPGTLVGLKERIAKSNDPNKQMKIAELDKIINVVSNPQTSKMALGSNFDGTKIMIGNPEVDPVTGNIIDHNIVVDIRTGQVMSGVSLAGIQNDESASIQMKIAPGFNSKAQGYENKNVTYK